MGARVVGPELLRVVLMGMIILHHLLVHGLNLKTAMASVANSGEFLLLQISLNALTVFAVNAFVLISGYFGVSYKTKSFVFLVLQGLAYTVLLMLIFRGMGYSGGGVIPTKYWFLLCFVSMYLLAPYINLAIGCISDRGVLVLVVMVAFLQFIVGYLADHGIFGSGYSVQQLLAIYVYGRALNRYRLRLEKISWKVMLVGFVVCWALVAGAATILFLTSHPRWAWRMYSYDSPLVVLGAVCLFLISLKVTIQSEWIRSVSRHVFGVYLFHDNEYFSKYVIVALVPVCVTNSGQMLLLFPGFVIGLMLIGMIVDIGISKILDVVLVNRFLKKVIEKIDSVVVPSQQQDISGK